MSNANSPFQAFPYVLTVQGTVKLLLVSEWAIGEKLERIRIIAVIITVVIIAFLLRVK
jgi:hypothetical protein